MTPTESELPTQLDQAVADLLATHDPTRMSDTEFLGARFDAGLAWVHFPIGLGGLAASPQWQPALEDRFVAAGADRPEFIRNPIGLGMAAPTVLHHGSVEQQSMLRSLWTAEDVWCQLFSEPGAGSDLAGLGTRAVADGDQWVVNGQKVWTSMAHLARWALLLARTDPAVPKHEGLTYFILDMTDPGVEVRPLRQATGQAEFNEVFLTDVRIPDSMRLDGVGRGWDVARTTLSHERTAIAGRSLREGSNSIGNFSRLASMWRSRPELRTPAAYPEVLRAWADTEVSRITNERTGQQLASGQPGVEGSGAKVALAANNQRATRLAAQLSPADALTYDSWDVDGVPVDAFDPSRPETFRYLRARAFSIEGGTSEILLGQIADRVLGLPREPRVDPATPWQELPR